MELSNMRSTFDMLLEQILNEEFAPIYRGLNYKLAVFYEPLGNPSFHVYYKNDWSVSLSMKDLTILEVKFGDFEKGNRLPNKIRKELKSILRKSYIGDVTNWQHLIKTWNIINPKYKINIPLPE